MTLPVNPACDRVRSQSSVELDGKLSQLERAMMAAHLERCPACRTFRDDIVHITAALRAAPLERLEHPVVLPPRRRVLSTAARLGAAAASAVVALGVGLNLSGVVTSSGLESHAAKRPAYLDSADYEQRIIEHVRGTRLAQRISRAV